MKLASTLASNAIFLSLASLTCVTQLNFSYNTPALPDLAITWKFIPVLGSNVYVSGYILNAKYESSISNLLFFILFLSTSVNFIFLNYFSICSISNVLVHVTFTGFLPLFDIKNSVTSSALV